MQWGNRAMFEVLEDTAKGPVLKVIGVGGGGCNAVKHMIAKDVQGVVFICANTDVQSLEDIDKKRAQVLQLGTRLTNGNGAGADPEKGRAAALEDRERIADALTGADMAFITAGMGGGTGTGAAPVVAEVAQELDILTVAVVTCPFQTERRMSIAEAGVKELRQHVDSLIKIPNQRLLSVLGKDTSMLDAFAESDDVLRGAVQGIADLIIRPGMINVDFADVRTVMSEMGMAMMGAGTARGENRSREAIKAAIHNPLLEEMNLQGARSILVNITADKSLSLGEFQEVGDAVDELAAEKAIKVMGTAVDAQMTDEVKVTVIAAGLCAEQASRDGARGMTLVQSRPARRTREAPNYAELDRPAIERKPRGGAAAGAAREARDGAARTIAPKDLFDVPAFLRQQVD